MFLMYPKGMRSLYPDWPSLGNPVCRDWPSIGNVATVSGLTPASQTYSPHSMTSMCQAVRVSVRVWQLQVVTQITKTGHGPKTGHRSLFLDRGWPGDRDWRGRPGDWRGRPGHWWGRSGLLFWAWGVLFSLSVCLVRLLRTGSGQVAWTWGDGGGWAWNR